MNAPDAPKYTTTYATTRRLVDVPPPDLGRLPAHADRRGEGGLRLRGRYKASDARRPLVSVITPVYNDAACLERALHSVLEQPYDNVEYIVVDGGSDDGTVDLLRRHDDAIDYWVSEPDLGIYDAMNKGVHLASGQWLYFLGADDILVKVLHRVVPALRSQRRIYYGSVYMPGINKFYAGPFDAQKLAGQNICHQAIFYPRRVFDHYSYSLKYPRAADWELNIKCWGDRRFRFVYLPELIAVFNDARFDPTMRDRVFHADREAIVRSEMGRALLGRRLVRTLKKAVGRVWAHVG